MPLKALDSGNWGYYSWWSVAIQYAVDNGAAVINMSMGGTAYSQTLFYAVRYAYNANVPIATAMMNSGDATPYYPAKFMETIAVGNTDRNDSRNPSSSFGSHIDLVAPGTAIPSTVWDDIYQIWSGTSMSAPHVTGVLGLIQSARPGYTIEELRNILWRSSDDWVGLPSEDVGGWDQYYGAGRLNAGRALRMATTPRTFLPVIMKNQ